MQYVKRSGVLGLAVLAGLAGPAARAQEPWYAGASIGRSRARIDQAGITAGLLGAGFTGATLGADTRDTGFKVFAGYELNRHFSLEGGWFDLGQFGYSASTVPPGTLKGEIKVRGLDLEPVFRLPFTDRFSGFVRGGLTYAQSRDSFSGTGFVRVADPNPRKDAFSYKFGGGLQYDVTRSVGMRLETERYRINDAVGNKGDIDLVSLGLVVRFGRQAAPGSQGAAGAAPVPSAAAQELPPAAAPAAPVLVIVPVPAATQEYCTILDIQFNIEKDDIQPVDKEKLAVLGAFLARYPATTAVIEGHADNVGSAEFNLALSRHRAESVVAYLVGDLHIDRSRLSAVGYGNTRPVADNLTEAGRRANRRVDAVVPCVTDVEGLAVAPARLTMALYIDFDQNRAGIKPEYDPELGKVARLLKANPAITATVEGHTGNLQATPALAMTISRQRAQNVVDYLVDNLGIERSRLTAEGFGDHRRFAYNTSAEGEQENRRVNIIFHYPE